MVEIVADKSKQWRMLRALTESHGWSMSDVIFALSCHAESSEASEELIDALGALSWKIPDDDETPTQAFDRAMYYESRFGRDMLQRSKHAVRVIESL